MKGIDVSSHQGTLDWGKIKENGIEFAMLRAGYGKNNIDAQFVRNATECTRLKIPFGVYWFSYAYTVEMAKKEANYCLNITQNYKLEYPICFDLEYDTVEYAKKNDVTITKSLATEMVIAFCEVIKNAGYYVMNYSNQDYLNNYFDLSKIKKYDLWFARYADAPKRDDMSIWQYTESGKLDGIANKLDMNISYKDYPTIIKDAGLNGFEKPAKTGWIKVNDHWWYRHEDGSYSKNDWELIDGKWYLFDKDGWMLVGWQQSKEKWYYMNSDGSMTIGLKIIEERFYYFNENGSMAEKGETVTLAPNEKGELN